jgi:hypothetical protein
LWDVSIESDTDGKLQLTLLNFFNNVHRPASGVPALPLDTWFHIEIQIIRSAQANGQVTVLQNGVLAMQVTNTITDDTDWGQWYVGNYAREIVPTLSKVYVDDVTIREEPWPL